MADINSSLPTTDTTDGVIGSAAPTVAQQVGGSDGTDLRAISTDSTGKVNINNISGTVSLPTGASTSANQTNASQKTQIVDGSGNVISSYDNQLNTSDIINISGQYRAQSITTSATEALGGATILTNRKLLSITPTNGTIYWGFSNSVTTTTGTPIFKNQSITFAIGTTVHIYLIAATTVDSRIAEGS